MRCMVPIAIVLAALGGGISQAATLSETYGVSTSYSFTSNQKGEIGLDGFDPSLGTLTGISYTLAGQATDTLTAAGGTSAMFPATFSNDLSVFAVTGGGGVPVGTSDQQSGFASTAQASTAFDVDVDVTGSITQDLMFYDYGGSELLLISNTEVENADTLAPVSYDAEQGTFNGSLTETFTFDPVLVPEPGTLPVFAVAMLGLLGVAGWQTRGRRRPARNGGAPAA